LRPSGFTTAAGRYLRQKPVEGSKAGGLPTLPFHLSLPSLFPFRLPPKFSDKPVGGKIRSSEGEVPRLPPTNTTLLSRALNTWVRRICDFDDFD